MKKTYQTPSITANGDVIGETKATGGSSNIENPVFPKQPLVNGSFNL